MRKPRGKPTGRSYTISCTDGEWAAIGAGAARAGKRVSPWFVECALTVDPWPERHRRLVLDAAEQRAVLRGVDEIARGLGLDPASAPGRSGGTPRFIADLGALFETRLRRMAARGRREDAIAHLREVLDDKRADAIAAAVIPEEAVTPAPSEPREMSEPPEEGGTGGDAGRSHEPGSDDEPQGSLGL